MEQIEAWFQPENPEVFHWEVWSASLLPWPVEWSGNQHKSSPGLQNWVQPGQKSPTIAKSCRGFSSYLQLVEEGMERRPEMRIFQLNCDCISCFSNPLPNQLVEKLLSPGFLILTCNMIVYSFKYLWPVLPFKEEDSHVPWPFLLDSHLHKLSEDARMQDGWEKVWTHLSSCSWTDILVMWCSGTPSNQTVWTVCFMHCGS